MGATPDHHSVVFGLVYREEDAGAGLEVRRQQASPLFLPWSEVKELLGLDDEELKILVGQGRLAAVSKGNDADSEVSLAKMPCRAR